MSWLRRLRADGHKRRCWPERLGLQKERSDEPGSRPRADLDPDPWDGGVLLCRARRLRSRRRHAVRARTRRILPQQDHEYDRADLGRQRDLAGPGRPRALGRVSARLRYHHPSCIFSHSGDAAGAHFLGVAFEFRFRDAENKTFWDHAFCYGSAVATFAQGVVLGSFVQGFSVRDGQFAGTSLSFLTPFSVLTGVALMLGYGLLGAGWLILKTEGDIQAEARRLGRICLIGVVTAIAIVSIWTPIMVPAVAARWFSWPNVALFAPVPVLSGVVALKIWRSLDSKAEAAPFFGAIGLFVLTYIGMAISLYPMIVPYQLTLWEAASSPRTQAFLLVGTLFLLPIILTYSSWSYWVFRGKVRSDVGYE